LVLIANALDQPVAECLDVRLAHLGKFLAADPRHDMAPHMRLVLLERAAYSIIGGDLGEPFISSAGNVSTNVRFRG
jgi:hypothetical protein